jgi:hypothetical protein
MSNLHRRAPPSIELDQMDTNAPLLSSSDDESQSPQRWSYGSSSSSKSGDVAINIHNPDPLDDYPVGSSSQDGVQRADALNMAWSKSTLILAYCL